MHKLTLAVLACCALSGSPAAFCQAASSPSASMGGMGHGSSPMQESMMGGMQKMRDMKPTGDADKDFAAMMRVHHQQAVDMAKVELQQGKSPELKAMARKIIEGQQKEIAAFDKWLAQHK